MWNVFEDFDPAAEIEIENGPGPVDAEEPDWGDPIPALLAASDVCADGETSECHTTVSGPNDRVWASVQFPTTRRRIEELVEAGELDPHQVDCLDEGQLPLYINAGECLDTNTRDWHLIVDETDTSTFHTLREGATQGEALRHALGILGRLAIDAPHVEPEPQGIDRLALGAAAVALYRATGTSFPSVRRDHPRVRVEHHRVAMSRGDAEWWAVTIDGVTVSDAHNEHDAAEIGALTSQLLALTQGFAEAMLERPAYGTAKPH